jgi:hypothetical protein
MNNAIFSLSPTQNLSNLFPKNKPYVLALTLLLQPSCRCPRSHQLNPTFSHHISLILTCTWSLPFSFIYRQLYWHIDKCLKITRIILTIHNQSINYLFCYWPLTYWSLSACTLLNRQQQHNQSSLLLLITLIHFDNNYTLITQQQHLELITITSRDHP